MAVSTEAERAMNQGDSLKAFHDESGQTEEWESLAIMAGGDPNALLNAAQNLRLTRTTELYQPGQELTVTESGPTDKKFTLDSNGLVVGRITTSHD